MTETTSLLPRLFRRQNPAVEQYASLLIRLHEQMRNGNEEEAEAIREQMDAPGLLLNEDEIQLVKGLSADLYMLAGEELLRPSGYTPSDYEAAFADAMRRRDYPKVLDLLRKKERASPEAQVASRRAIVYKWLGLREAYRQFLLFAAELAPKDLSYRSMILNEFGDLNQASEIQRLANEVFEDPSAQPASIFNAAGALFFLASGPLSSDKRLYLGKARRKIQEAFNRYPVDRLPPVVATLGLLILGAILEALNRKSEAKRVYKTATEINPSESIPWVILGTLWLQDDPSQAMPCFKRAVDLETSNPLPYLALAKDALEHRDYQEAKRLSETLLEMIQENGDPTDSPLLSAQIYEFLGLAEAEQHGPTEMATRYLREAVSLNPEDVRMQHNYAQVLSEAEAKSSEASDPAKQHKRLSEWFDALQRDTPSSTSMFLGTLQRPSEIIWEPWTLAAAV